MKLIYLFELCLNANYTRTENSGDFAIVSRGSETFLLFQCSNGLEDWKNNFDFPAVPYKDMGERWFCHKGFLRVWKSIEPQISDYIKNSRAQKMSVVGYSHGAAIATLAHEYVWFLRPDLRPSLSGYGFGCPRCYFGAPLKASLRERWKNFYPVRNVNDIVTHLPPALLGFRHVNRVIEIGTRGKYSRIDAHRPESYLAELELADRSSLFADISKNC